jgi:hypothetical protein
MMQLYSTDRLLMAENEMTEALKHPNPSHNLAMTQSHRCHNWQQFSKISFKSL